MALDKSVLVDLPEHGIAYKKVSGKTYVYYVTATYRNEKGKPTCDRSSIGRLDEATGKLIPNRNYYEIYLKTPVPEKKGIYNYGVYDVFDKVCTKLGVTKLLKRYFPEQFEEILAVAQYMLSEGNVMYYIDDYTEGHCTRFKGIISDERCSKLFSSVRPEDVMLFFREWIKQKKSNEYVAYDVTSISSYSKNISELEWGYNRDKEKLPQLNLGMYFGEESNLPLYYRTYPGSISDKAHLRYMLADNEFINAKRTQFVMDRGFYSEGNINSLYREHVKFLVGVKLSLKFIRKNLDEVYDNIRMFNNYDDGIATYGYTVSTDWDYTQQRPYKGDVIRDKRRIYIHFYYSIEKGADDEQAFDKRIASLYKELLEDNTVESHKKAYEQFFEVKITPKRGRQIAYKEDAIKEARKYFGYFALITNETMDAFTALHLYRMKDVVEKAFGNIKERLNMRRLLVSSEKGLDGKIFTEFVALILISHLDHKMKESGLYSNYTLQSLLDKLDVLECFEDANHSLRVGEMLNKQAEIYEALGVEAPASSC